MHASPTAVVTHLRVSGGKEERRESRKPVAAQIRLMVKPGMTTEARPCHIRVSVTAVSTLLVLSLSLEGDFCKSKKKRK